MRHHRLMEMTLTDRQLIFNEAWYQPNLTAVHVSTVQWVIKITLCWETTQTHVVPKQWLGCHENNLCSQAVALKAGLPAAPDPLTGLLLHRGEQICHCQSFVSHLLPPLLCICLLSPCVCTGLSGSYELQRVSVITLCYISACNLCSSCSLIVLHCRPLFSALF